MTTYINLILSFLARDVTLPCWAVFIGAISLCFWIIEILIMCAFMRTAKELREDAHN